MMKLLRWWFTPRLPLDVLDDAIAQARKEEREAIIAQMEAWFVEQSGTNLMWAADQLRARGEGKNG